MATNPDEEQKEIVAKATSSKQGIAKARRSASHITAYKKGDQVPAVDLQ